MFTRLFSFFIVLIVLYALSVFMIPSVADRYVNKYWNDQMRSLKTSLESYSGSTTSLYEQVRGSAESIISETKSTKQQIEKTIQDKTQEIKETTESVQNAVNAVEKAKEDLEKLGKFGTGTAQ